MFLYSQTVHSFLARLRSYSREILEKEMKLHFKRSRLYLGGIYYPLNFVVFEGSQLGYWDRRCYQLGINKRLMYTAKSEVLKNILRHELAHMYLSYTSETSSPHSPEFRELCKGFGWGESVFSASAFVEEENAKREGDLVSERLIEKIKKLLALTTSSNPHEAELATIKANELLLRHNLEKIQVLDQEEEVWVKRVLEAKRNNARLHAIYEILQTFFVAPVFNYGKEVVYLEVTGSKTNVELADYVANFLDLELERLYEAYQKDHPEMKGKSAKNSFMKGLAEGYCQKIKTAQEQVSDSRSLVTLNQDLKRKVRLAYSRLGSSAVSKSSDSYSKNIGIQAGRSLSIHGAISKGLSKISGYLR